MLELEGLRRTYGSVVALDGLTLTVSSGTIYGLLGPNGAGKTTAMRCVMGVTRPDAGRVLWNGRAIGRDDRLHFGYLPEERGLYPSMRVRDHLVYLAQLHGVRRQDARTRAEEWLERLGLASRATDKVGALSLGNMQRVQLAAALVHVPELLVLDEPFSGLDPVGVDTLASILSAEAARGVTIVFSSHQLDLVEGYCRHVGIMSSGRAVAEGEVAALTSADTRLVVEVAGDHDGAWAAGLPGVTVSERIGGRVRLSLAEDVDPDAVLDAARAAGRVTHFGTQRLRLSEVFRAATGRTPDVARREPAGAGVESAQAAVPSGPAGAP